MIALDGVDGVDGNMVLVPSKLLSKGEYLKLKHTFKVSYIINEREILNKQTHMNIDQCRQGMQSRLNQ